MDTIEIPKREQEGKVLRANYGKTSDEKIRELLGRITPVLKDKKGNLYRLDKETEEEIFKRPKSFSFTFKNKFGAKIKEDLQPFIQIDVLVDSASPWTLQPDIGEVFDQMTEEELSQTKALWLDIRADEDERSSYGVYVCTLYK